MLACSLICNVSPAASRRAFFSPTAERTGAFDGLALRCAEDLLPFLPTDLPRFQRHDRPLPGAAWELDELVGVSDLGEMWRARRENGSEVANAAIKFCTDPTVLHRLQSHEATALERYAFYGRHSGLVPLIEIYLEADPPCLVYEFVDGPDLAAIIHAFHRQPERSPATAFAWSAALVFELSGIMAFAHRMMPPLVHQDLKPSNIKVQRRRRWPIFVATDGFRHRRSFLESRRGVGTHSQNARRNLGQIASWFLHASLRLTTAIGRRGADPRDDVYALGVIWYQMITGNLGAGKPEGLEWTHRLHKLGMNADLIELLASCLEENQEDRPADAGDLATRLENAFKAERSESVNSTSRASSTVRPGVLQRPKEQEVPKSDPKSSDVPARTQRRGAGHQLFARRPILGVRRQGWPGTHLECLRQFRSAAIPVSAGGLNSIDFSPDGRLLLTGGKDTRLRLLDASQAKNFAYSRGMCSALGVPSFRPTAGARSRAAATARSACGTSSPVRRCVASTATALVFGAWRFPATAFRRFPEVTIRPFGFGTSKAGKNSAISRAILIAFGP